MSGQERIDRLIAEFASTARGLRTWVEESLRNLPRGDSSGWYYIESVAADQADGRHRASIKLLPAPVSANNPVIATLPCLRSYTPVVGHRVLVRWIGGARRDGQADGVIEG